MVISLTKQTMDLTRIIMRQRWPTFKAQYWYLVIWWFLSLYRSRGVNIMLKGPAHWLNKMKRWCLRLCWGKRNLLWWTREKNAVNSFWEQKHSEYNLCHYYTAVLSFGERINFIFQLQFSLGNKKCLKKLSRIFFLSVHPSSLASCQSRK